MQLSDEVKLNFDTFYDDRLKTMEDNLNEIKANKYYESITINGKNKYEAGTIICNHEPDCNPDGYYIKNIYPYFPYVSYTDENGINQYKYFGTYGNNYVNSKKEYDNVLKNEIIPFCDDLLARGLITLEEYDEYTIADPLDKYVKLYFD